MITDLLCMLEQIVTFPSTKPPQPTYPGERRRLWPQRVRPSEPTSEYNIQQWVCFIGTGKKSQTDGDLCHSTGIQPQKQWLLCPTRSRTRYALDTSVVAWDADMAEAMMCLISTLLASVGPAAGMATLTVETIPVDGVLNGETISSRLVESSTTTLRSIYRSQRSSRRLFVPPSTHSTLSPDSLCGGEEAGSSHNNFLCPTSYMCQGSSCVRHCVYSSIL